MIHKRTQSPARFKRYQDYKRFLRIEFSYKCVYCQVREPEIGGTQSFHIDHYKPVSKFSELENSYDNLLYSCRFCNQHKSTYWPSITQQVLGKVVINLCIHVFNKHIDVFQNVWLGLTKMGKWNIERLRLNAPRIVKIRNQRSDIEKTIETLSELREMQVLALKKAQLLQNPVATSAAQLAINSLQSQLQSLNDKISGPMD